MITRRTARSMAHWDAIGTTVLVLIGVIGCGGDDPSSAGAAAGGSGGATPGAGGSDVGNGGALTGSGGGGNAGGSGSGGVTGSGGAATGGSPGSGGDGAGGSSATDCDPSQTLPPGDHEFTIQSANGLTYKYVLVMPDTVVAGKKAPLAVVWHALWSSPEETRGLTHIDATMAGKGTISVHPRSPDQSWDVGTCCTNIVLGMRRDETVFAKELLKDVESKVCVDTRRVYTAGFSNGGMISQMLACKMSDTFAAAAPMGSTLTIPKSECTPSRPVPIFAINGTADPLVGYSAVGLSGGITIPDDFQTWADADQCTGTPEVTVQQGKATCKTYKNCGGGAEVTFCGIEGMGHCMPGMQKESSTNCFTKNLIPLGPPNDDIDGITLSAEFMERFSLP